MNTVTIEPNQVIDPYLRAHRSRTIFRLREGCYTTFGHYAFADLDYCMLAPGCAIEGAGRYRTTLYASGDRVPVDGTQIECLTAGSRRGASYSVAISGLTVRPRAESRIAELGVVGIHVWSDHVELADIGASAISGVRTASGPSREGFGVLVNQSGRPMKGGIGGGHIHGVEVCVSTTAELGSVTGAGVPVKSEHYVCGFYVGIENPDLPSVVTDVSVINPGSVPAHAAFGVNGGVMGGYWRNTGLWNRAIFCDTRGGAGTQIEASRFVAGRVGAEFRGTDVNWTDILVRGSQFTLDPLEGAAYVAGLVLVDDGGSTFDNVRFDDCVLRGVAPASPRTVDFYRGSASGTRMLGCGVSSRVLGTAWKGPVVASGVPLAGFSAS